MCLPLPRSPHFLGPIRSWAPTKGLLLCAHGRQVALLAADPTLTKSGDPCNPGPGTGPRDPPLSSTVHLLHYANLRDLLAPKRPPTPRPAPSSSGSLPSPPPSLNPGQWTIGHAFACSVSPLALSSFTVLIGKTRARLTQFFASLNLQRGC